MLRIFLYDDVDNLIEKCKKQEVFLVLKHKLQVLYGPNSGMLIVVLRPDGAIISFTYDMFGRRLTKKFKSTTTHWLWDGNKPLHQWKTFETKDALT
ncbi:hypothetical protein ACFSX9_10600 [Flavobacterium ardleyense]|uniref:Uncharacterized protein n=1 Tax=Flavobacterium ardleyense TaxID=2038737 RepID=A0ABW5Z8I1_9FLAO